MPIPTVFGPLRQVEEMDVSKSVTEVPEPSAMIPAFVFPTTSQASAARLASPRTTIPYPPSPPSSGWVSSTEVSRRETAVPELAATKPTPVFDDTSQDSASRVAPLLTTMP